MLSLWILRGETIPYDLIECLVKCKKTLKTSWRYTGSGHLMSYCDLTFKTGKISHYPLKLRVRTHTHTHTGFGIISMLHCIHHSSSPPAHSSGWKTVQLMSWREIFMRILVTGRTDPRQMTPTQEALPFFFFFPMKALNMLPPAVILGSVLQRKLT